MISLYTVFIILIVHWIADFVLQTDKQAKGKSNNWNDLLEHTINYSIVWLPTMVLLCFINNIELINIKIPFLFFIITLVCHTITDYFTSRLNTKLWNKGDVHNFFVSIGFDQVLHYVQLFLTYYLLTN